MPYKNPKNCMYPGCKNLVYKGRYCSIHKVNTTKYRNSKEWKQLREQVLQEEPICRICGKRASTEVDHIISLPQGSKERWNLQGVCKSCHSAKTRREVSR